MTLQNQRTADGRRHRGRDLEMCSLAFEQRFEAHGRERGLPVESMRLLLQAVLFRQPPRTLFSVGPPETRRSAVISPKTRRCTATSNLNLAVGRPRVHLGSEMDGEIRRLQGPTAPKANFLLRHRMRMLRYLTKQTFTVPPMNCSSGRRRMPLRRRHRPARRRKPSRPMRLRSAMGDAGGDLVAGVTSKRARPGMLRWKPELPMFLRCEFPVRRRRVSDRSEGDRRRPETISRRCRRDGPCVLHHENLSIRRRNVTWNVRRAICAAIAPVSLPLSANVAVKATFGPEQLTLPVTEDIKAWAKACPTKRAALHERRPTQRQPIDEHLRRCPHPHQQLLHRDSQFIRPLPVTASPACSRSALPMTLTEDSAIAAAAIIGDSRMPKTG